MSWFSGKGQELSGRQEGEGYPRHWAQHLQNHSKMFKHKEGLSTTGVLGDMRDVTKAHLADATGQVTG